MAAQEQLSSFADALRTARKTAGMSQADLAELLEIRQSTVSVWEQGLKEPSRDNVGRVEEALGLDGGALSSLLGWVPPEPGRKARPAPLVPVTIKAIKSDKTLDRRGRSLMMALYRTLSDGGLSHEGIHPKRWSIESAA
jgi:transcriptional regulator with XRE-family HTH domain